MLTIDGLRKLDGQVMYNPLGVIKYRFRGDQTYHFYSEMAPPLHEYNIHNHRYSFTSTVKKGGLKNFIYEVEPTDEYTDYQATKCRCILGEDFIDVEENVNYYEVANFTTSVNESYSLDFRTLHTIELLAPKVVTFVQRSPKGKEDIFAHFVTNKLEPQLDPLDHTKSEKECWEIIEYTLAD
jgi:hypothetical protein